MIESDYLKDNIDFVKQLKEIPALEPFEDKNLQGLLRLSKIRKYESEELILKEGSYDSWIYFLVSGEVKIVKENKEISVLKRKGDVLARWVL